MIVASTSGWLSSWPVTAELHQNCRAIGARQPSARGGGGHKSYAGWWFQTWILFAISYMGCHPSHWLIQYFSRWLEPPTRKLWQRCKNNMNRWATRLSSCWNRAAEANMQRFDVNLPFLESNCLFFDMKLYELAGGLELVSHILGIIIPTDFHIFQMGWNHQPLNIWRILGLLKTTTCETRSQTWIWRLWIPKVNQQAK